MIDLSDEARAILDGSFTYYMKVSSWLGDDLLEDDVPVANGSEEADRSLNVPERVTFTVPRYANGFDWSPTSDDHPLAANGQTLKVSLGVGRGPDGVEWFQRGEFLIIETETDGNTITVNCAGLLYLIDEAKFISPFQPTGTIASTVRDLIEPALTANLDAAPADRAVPTSAANWDEDRLGALYDLLDAWPAVPFMNENGFLEILPDVTPTVAVRTFTNGSGGTVVSASGTSSRDGGFNAVVATGYDSTGAEVRAVVYVTDGPWAYGSGAANPLPVPYGYASTLLTTQAQCLAAANTVLARKMREAVLRTYTIEASPDPTLQLGDCVAITTDDVTDLLCTVEAISLPYKPGSMTLKVVSTS